MSDNNQGPRVGDLIDTTPVEESKANPMSTNVRGSQDQEHILSEGINVQSQPRLMSASNGETDEFLKSAGRDVMSDKPVPELPHIPSKASLPAKDSFQSGS